MNLGMNFSQFNVKKGKKNILLNKKEKIYRKMQETREIFAKKVLQNQKN